MSMIAKIVHLKEKILVFYATHADILCPVMKGVFSFIALMVIRDLFPYDARMDRPLLLLAVSVIQAFIPTITMFFTAFILVLSSAWHVSLDVFGLFLIVMMVYLMTFGRSEKKYIYVMLLTVILFRFHLEFLLPVILGMMIGYGAILPCIGGAFLYFLSKYTAEAFTVLNAAEHAEVGMGLQRIFDLLTMDKYMLTVIITFALIVLLSSCLEQLLHERAWLFALMAGNIGLALLMLVGKLFFDYDLSMIVLFIEVIISIAFGQIIMLFKGLGDISRIERVSFEDDEYIYYVKAVPKMKMTHEQSYEKIIKAEKED